MGLFGKQSGKTNKENDPPFPQAYLPRIHYQTAQSTGLVRSHNEDAISAFSASVLTAEARFSFGLFIVADGMGGHLNGEVASELAVQMTSAGIMRMIYDPLRLGRKNLPDEEISEALEKSIHAAHEAVLRQVPGGGTTLTVALVLNQMLFTAHVGDSRLYLSSRHAAFAPLTHDHTIVCRLTELGQISDREARDHPSRNVLFRAIGQQEGFKIDFYQRPIAEPAQLMLCSDGLWGLVEDKRLESMLDLASKNTFAAEKLVEMANAAGGTDNISVILVTLD